MSIIDFRAHHVGLSVPDLEASIKWYGEILGFEVEKKMDMPHIGAKIAYLKRDDFRIELFEMEKAVAMSEDRTVPNKDLLTHGWKHLSIEVEDATEALKTLKEKGIDIAMENVVDGVAMGFIRDNAGNLIEINQVGTPFADK
jgi:methylmalonyl-CoA/ethylmalonyl-CoA epimerase